MGIFGALTNAVTGLRAQSFALENISGNIANSQTTGFKRIDTSFQDLIPDNAPSKQTAGSVLASSRSTNVVQGDIQNASIGTFMAVNGEGFFVVQKPSAFSDNRPVFDGIDMYTRRGDFQTDRNGYLVNGAGYYLAGIPVDATTGNLVGSVPQLLQFQNDFLPAQATTQIEYRANLANYPKTGSSDASVLGSELLQPANYAANPAAGAPAPAKILGTGATLRPDAKALGLGTVGGLTGATTLASLGLGTTDTITVNDGTNPTTTFNVAGGSTVQNLIDAINGGTADIAASLDGSGKLQLVSANFTDAITVGGTGAAVVGFGAGHDTFAPTNLLTQSAASLGQTLTVTVASNPTQTITFGTGAGQVATLAQLLTQLQGLSGVTGNVNTSNGNVTLTAANLTDTITVGGTVTPRVFGMRTTTALPSNQVVVGSDATTFLKESIGGGAVTAYQTSGAPVNVQFRWAKVASSTTGGTDTWNMFYQVNANATGSEVAWQNAGINYQFSANGQMNPSVPNTTLSNVTVDGVALGTIQLVHGSGGITQFADANGSVQVNMLQQNGFPAGELQSVAVNDKGRVVGSYSNGRSIDLAEITLANFSGANALKRLDGGAFAITSDSGPPVYGAPGKIVGSSLEGSNVDIADEFSKLIVTQQAYSANTRIVTTSNQMVQDLLNMLR